MAFILKEIVGEAGFEPASPVYGTQDPKSCVSASFTTRPLKNLKQSYHNQADLSFQNHS